MKILERINRRAVILLIGLLIGASLFVIAKITQKSPQYDPHLRAPVSATVINVNSVNFMLQAKGFGVAQPAETWQAIANVAGRVIKINPNLKSGMIVKQGTELLRLDPSRFQLAISQAKADIASLTAELSQLTTERLNTNALLSLSKERLSLSEKELSRFEKLVKRDMISISQKDEILKATVAQRQELQTHENQMALFPSRFNNLKSKQLSAQSKLEQAQLNLNDTVFVAPYDLRVKQVNVENNQYASTGQALFWADNIKEAEIEAQIPVSVLQRLIGAASKTKKQSTETFDLSKRFNLESINSEVFLVDSKQAKWAATVKRIASGLDPKTRAGRIVVSVNEPYRSANLPIRPALQPDMYVQVILSVINPEPVIAIPVSSIHQGSVYLVDAENKLIRRAVKISFVQNDLAVISSGLEPGDIVIVDDLLMSVNGMSIASKRNIELESRIAATAMGESL